MLADRVNDLLDDYAGGEATEQAAAAHADLAPLETPIEEDFRVGTMGLSWDPNRQLVIIECHAAGDAFDDPEELAESAERDPADDPTQLVLRISLSPAAARHDAILRSRIRRSAIRVISTA